jgi:hypothetical protein
MTEVDADAVGKIQSLRVTCKTLRLDRFTYLVDVLQRIGRHPALDVEPLTPRLWKEHFALDPLRSDIDRQVCRCLVAYLRSSRSMPNVLTVSDQTLQTSL